MDITLEEFKDKFKNRNLEPYTDVLYNALGISELYQGIAQQKNKFESDLASILGEALGLLYLIQDLLSGEFIYKKMPVKDPRIIGMLVNDLELAYRMKIELYRNELDERFVENMQVGEYPVLFTMLTDEGEEKASNDVRLGDEDDVKISTTIPDPPIGQRLFGGGLNHDVETYIKVVRTARDYAVKKAHFDDELPIKAFLKRCLELGIPTENKYYLELYECLQLIGAISPATLQDHSKSSDPYIAAVFMRGRFNRLKGQLAKGIEHTELGFTLHVDDDKPVTMRENML